MTKWIDELVLWISTVLGVIGAVVIAGILCGMLYSVFKFGWNLVT